MCFRKLVLTWYPWGRNGDTSSKGISEEDRGHWPATPLVTLSHPKHSMSIQKPEKSVLPPKYEVVLPQ